MAKADEPSPREPGPWGRRFVTAIHAFTWTLWIGGSLYFLISLGSQGEYGTLALVAVVAASFFAAARFGARESAGKRMMLVTIIAAIGAIAHAIKFDG